MLTPEWSPVPGEPERGGGGGKRHHLTLHGTCLDFLDSPLLGYVGVLHSDTLREDPGTGGNTPHLY